MHAMQAGEDHHQQKSLQYYIGRKETPLLLNQYGTKGHGNKPAKPGCKIDLLASFLPLKNDSDEWACEIPPVWDPRYVPPRENDFFHLTAPL